MVELLVTLAIITVLATLGFQGYRSARLRANEAVSTANLRQLAAANLLYAADHFTYSPASDRFNRIRWHGGRAKGRSKFDPAKGYLSEYLGGSGRVGVCPEFLRHLSGTNSWEDGSGGYGYNAVYLGGYLNYDDSGNPVPQRPGNVGKPERTLMFATTALSKAEGIQEYPFAEAPKFVDSEGNITGEASQASIHFRFNGRALVAWCDGHISSERSQGEAQKNVYGGNNKEANIGFCGPTANNGWWNPEN